MSTSHHHHHDGHEETFTERSTAHWDRTASTYASEPWQKEMINKTHSFLLSNLSWLGVDLLDPSATFEGPSHSTDDPPPLHQVRVLDYACGPGTITNILIDRATEFIGIDLSQNMVKAYNERFSPDPSTSTSDPTTATISPKVNAHAVVGDLISPSGPPSSLTSPSFYNFDLACVGFGFHHFENLPLATARLVERLKPGGVFLIADFLHHAHIPEGSGEEVRRTIAHNGFGEAEVHEIFGGAGLVDMGFLKMPGEGVWMRFKGKEGEEGNGERKGQYREIFLAKGRKPVA